MTAMNHHEEAFPCYDDKYDEKLFHLKLNCAEAERRAAAQQVDEALRRLAHLRAANENSSFAEAYQRVFDESLLRHDLHSSDDLLAAAAREVEERFACLAELRFDARYLRDIEPITSVREETEKERWLREIIQARADWAPSTLNFGEAGVSATLAERATWRSNGCFEARLTSRSALDVRSVASSFAIFCLAVHCRFDSGLIPRPHHNVLLGWTMSSIVRTTVCQRIGVDFATWSARIRLSRVFGFGAPCTSANRPSRSRLHLYPRPSRTDFAREDNCPTRRRKCSRLSNSIPIDLLISSSSSRNDSGYEMPTLLRRWLVPDWSHMPMRRGSKRSSRSSDDDFFPSPHHPSPRTRSCSVHHSPCWSVEMQRGKSILRSFGPVWSHTSRRPSSI